MSAITTRTLQDGRHLEIHVETANDQVLYVAYIDGARYKSDNTLRRLAAGYPPHKDMVERGYTHQLCNVALTADDVTALTAAAAAPLAELAAKKARTVTIFLSMRGWGDYSSCQWHGDITRPDAEILAECRYNLTHEHDVDNPNKPDAEILDAIHKARTKWEAAQQPRAEQAERPIHAPGYCYWCESYCHGDCGHYAPTPTQETIMREADLANREANYGIND